MLSNANVATLLHLLAAALRAPAGSRERQTLVKQIMEDPALYNLLREQASNDKERAQQLTASNWLIWLQQEAKS